MGAGIAPENAEIAIFLMRVIFGFLEAGLLGLDADFFFMSASSRPIRFFTLITTPQKGQSWSHRRRWHRTRKRADEDLF